MPFWSSSKNEDRSDAVALVQPPQNAYTNAPAQHSRNPIPESETSPVYRQNTYERTEHVESEAAMRDDACLVKEKHRIQEQNDDLPTDLGDLQDIFSFEFMRGRWFWNFILAILWCIGLPILLYHILKPYLGQVVAMIVAASPPLAIVAYRMIKTRTFDLLGLIAGTSFLISGIISIAPPENDKVAEICESLIPLFVGLMCLISLIPIRIGSLTLKPVIFQLTSQLAPRTDTDKLNQQDAQRVSAPMSKADKMDWAYNNLARFRQDMRIITACWGTLLIIGFIIKVIVIMTETSMTMTAIAGYILFGVVSIGMLIFSWFYTNIVKGHIAEDLAFWKENQAPRRLDRKTEGVENVNWASQSVNNVWGQVMG